MSTIVTRNLIAELKLLGMSVAFEQALRDAVEHQWTGPEFVNVLLQAERDHRRERRVKGLIKAAKFEVKARLEDYDLTADRSLTKTDIKDLHSLEWLHQGRPVLLMGATGVGKSFVAQALGMQACLNGLSAVFLTVTTWIEGLALARSSGTYLEWREHLTRPAVVILDNFGARKLTAMEAQDLCEILDARTGERSTVVTTQLPLSHWTDVIGDPVIADAIRDRLEHAALKIEIKGESYRAVLARKLKRASMEQRS